MTNQFYEQCEVCGRWTCPGHTREVGFSTPTARFQIGVPQVNLDGLPIQISGNGVKISRSRSGLDTISVFPTTGSKFFILVNEEIEIEFSGIVDKAFSPDLALGSHTLDITLPLDASGQSKKIIYRVQVLEYNQSFSNPVVVSIKCRVIK